MKAEEFYNNKFHPKIVTVVSKATVIKLMEQYANKVNRERINNDSFWFDEFNERYPDEVAKIFDDREQNQQP